MCVILKSTPNIQDGKALAGAADNGGDDGDHSAKDDDKDDDDELKDDDDELKDDDDMALFFRYKPPPNADVDALGKTFKVFISLCISVYLSLI